MGLGLSYDQMNKSREDDEQGRYYLGNGLWTHPETGGISSLKTKAKINSIAKIRG